MKHPSEDTKWQQKIRDSNSREKLRLKMWLRVEDIQIKTKDLMRYR